MNWNDLGMITNQYMKRSIIHLGEILAMAVHLFLHNVQCKIMRKPVHRSMELQTQGVATSCSPLNPCAAPPKSYALLDKC